jgi:ubiquinone/menaquinone biosynthesis C-methylase UbiE
MRRLAALARAPQAWDKPYVSDVSRFVGSIPEYYDRHLGPVLFEPYAQDLAARLPKAARRVLEIAAGTGRLTRQLLARLPAHAELVATDLNEPMILEGMRRVGADPRLSWQTADALSLPFDAPQFDVVVCQFGLMFMPDKQLALAEMQRVLQPGGTLLVSTWDTMAKNPASALLQERAFEACPADPPTFMLTPFSMHDLDELRQLVTEAEFRGVRVDTVAMTGEAESAAHLATGFVRGNPLYNQLAERGLDPVAFEANVAAALARAFGDAPCRPPMSAHVVTAVV